MHNELSALADLGFLQPRFFTPGHWAAIIVLGSFAAIVDGERDGMAKGYQKSWLPIDYQNRWVYQGIEDAQYALEHWDGKNQPRGWISAQLAQDAI